MKRFIKLSLAITLLVPQLVLAADGATLVFKSGQVVFIDNGYQTLSTAMLALNKKDALHNATVQLTLEGSSFVVNVAEINLLCRDRCKNLEIINFQGSGSASTTINQNNDDKPLRKRRSHF